MKSPLRHLAPRPKGLLPLAALSLLLPLSSGCVTVKPWQRETLADPIMQPNRNPLATLQLDHVYFSREAASGGTTVGGGGCGCN
jgi:hypothetical protein